MGHSASSPCQRSTYGSGRRWRKRSAIHWRKAISQMTWCRLDTIHTYGDAAQTFSFGTPTVRQNRPINKGNINNQKQLKARCKWWHLTKSKRKTLFCDAKTIRFKISSNKIRCWIKFVGVKSELFRNERKRKHGAENILKGTGNAVEQNEYGIGNCSARKICTSRET